MERLGQEDQQNRLTDSGAEPRGAELPSIEKDDGTPLNTVGGSAVTGALNAFREATDAINKILPGEPDANELAPDAKTD